MSTQLGNNFDFGSPVSWGGASQWGMAPAAPASPGQTVNFMGHSVEGLKGMDLMGALASMAQIQAMTDQTAAIREANKPLTGWQAGVQNFGAVAQGLGSLYGIYGGLKAMKHQKEVFKYNKGVMDTNLNNSITDYNRRLTDTLSNRALNNGQGQGWVSDQLSKYSAKRSG